MPSAHDRFSRLGTSHNVRSSVVMGLQSGPHLLTLSFVRKRLVGGNSRGIRSRRLSELSLTRRQTAVSDLGCRDFGGPMPPSCADCREERLYPNDIHDAREIVGENVQGYLGRNLGQS